MGEKQQDVSRQTKHFKTRLFSPSCMGKVVKSADRFWKETYRTFSYYVIRPVILIAWHLIHVRDLMFQSKSLPHSRLLLSTLQWMGIIFSYGVTIQISTLWGSDSLQTTGWVARRRISNNFLEHVLLLLLVFSGVLDIWSKFPRNKGNSLQWKLKRFMQTIRNQVMALNVCLVLNFFGFFSSYHSTGKCSSDVILSPEIWGVSVT